MVAEDAGPQTVVGWAANIAAGPLNESDQQLAFEITANSSPDLFADLPHVDAVTGDLTFTSAPDAFGIATIRVRLVDDGGTQHGGGDASEEYEFTITVLPVPDLGTLHWTPSDLTILERESGASVATVHIDDPDPDDVHYIELSDPRFEIVDGQLRLKSGLLVNRTDEPSIPLTVTVTEAFGLKFEQDVVIAVLANNPWQNATLRWDVNGDGLVTPLDVLISINAYNLHGPRDLPYPPPSPPTAFFDVNGDGGHTPTDIVAVINYINSDAEAEWAEGESAGAEHGSDPSVGEILLGNQPPETAALFSHAPTVGALSQPSGMGSSARWDAVRPVAERTVGPTMAVPRPIPRSATPIDDEDFPMDAIDSVLDDLAADVSQVWSNYERLTASSPMTQARGN